MKEHQKRGSFVFSVSSSSPCHCCHHLRQEALRTWGEPAGRMSSVVGCRLADPQKENREIWKGGVRRSCEVDYSVWCGKLASFLEVSDCVKHPGLSALQAFTQQQEAMGCACVGSSCISRREFGQGWRFHMSCIPGHTVYGPLPLAGSAPEGMYGRRSGHQRGLHLYYSQLSKDVCPSTLSSSGSPEE